MRKERKGYSEALRIALDAIAPLGSEQIDLAAAADRVVAAELFSTVCSPSADASMKDGYAVVSADIADATAGNPVQLDLVGTAAAGCSETVRVPPSAAVRVLTGAVVPRGADAVLAEEFADCREGQITALNTANAGRNILPRGADVATGELIAAKGSRLTPGVIGLLAASGICQLPVYRQPRVAIVATGDELVVPGARLTAGQLYASNPEMLKAWCRRWGLSPTVTHTPDRPEAIREALARAIAGHDAVLTCGGAWSGDRDFVADGLIALGWKKRFQWVRMGPGKAVGFGTLEGKPIFLLPGGPPSNLTAFLHIALPGLLQLGGHGQFPLPRMMVALSQQLTCRAVNWTEFVYGTLSANDGNTVFQPLQMRSRLKTIALAQAVIAIQEGVASLAAGAVVPALLLE